MTFIQKIVCSLIISCCCLISLQAQNFENKGINYQAVISQSGSILENQEVLFRFTLLQEGGVPAYQGEQRLTTDDKGRISAVIGTGESMFDGLSEVDWTDPELSLQVEVDPDQAGFREISNEAIQSIPFSFVASEVINLPERNLNSLSDVSINDAEIGESLQWNGSNWVPAAAESLWTLDKDEESLSYEDGFVGIGTDDPTQRFTITEDNAETNKGQLLISQEGTGDAAINMGLVESSHYAIGIDNSDNDKFKIAFDDDRVAGLTNNTLLTLQPNGYLGLGTASPQRKLTLSSNDSSDTNAQMLIEQQGEGDAWMNFSLAGTQSYAMGIDNSDSDKFKIGTNGLGSPNGVNAKTLLELDTSGNLKVIGEVNNPNSGDANLLPIAYGVFGRMGTPSGLSTTSNFVATRISEGEYKIVLDDYLASVSDVIIVNVVGEVQPKIAVANNLISVGDPATFLVKTYSLSSSKLADAGVSFVIYRR
ncbi:MAG: hypothetical protein AAF824_19500 [Bacteroidota bacterium]